jgi:hypothetical protein
MRIRWLMLFKEIVAVYLENDTKHINTLHEQDAVLQIVKVGGTYSYHWALKD